MTNFETSPLLFVIIVLVVSALVGAVGGWRAVSVEIGEDEDSGKDRQAANKPEQGAAPAGEAG